MGLFDSYFDPQQFQVSGGLLGRLLSLQQQQGQYQPGAGFDPQIPADGQTPFVPQTPLSIAPPTLPNGAPTAAAPQTPDHEPTRNLSIGSNYPMLQFGTADVSQAAQQPPDLGDRLSAGFQSWAHTPVGNPFAALANGIAGLASGQRAGPAGIAQQILQPRVDSPGDPQQDLNAQYRVLRPILGDQNAMLAIVHPEVGKTLIAQALAGQAKSGNNAEADRARQRPSRSWQ